jgi:hypothetical protein
MRVEIYHPEERQALRDEEFVRCETEHLQWQEFAEEMEKNRKPAKIEVIYEETEEYDRIEADTLPF